MFQQWKLLVSIDSSYNPLTPSWQTHTHQSYMIGYYMIGLLIALLKTCIYLMKSLKMELMPFHLLVFSGSHQLFFGERELTKASKWQLHFFWLFKIISLPVAKFIYNFVLLFMGGLLKREWNQAWFISFIIKYEKFSHICILQVSQFAFNLYSSGLG